MAVYEKRAAVNGRPLHSDYWSLENLNVLSLPALGALNDVELDRLAFLKRTEAVRLDRGEVNEYVLTTLAAQKTKTLSIVKPLDCSLFHFAFSFYCLMYR